MHKMHLKIRKNKQKQHVKTIYEKKSWFNNKIVPCDIKVSIIEKNIHIHHPLTVNVKQIQPMYEAKNSVLFYAFQTLPYNVTFSVTSDATSFADTMGFANAQCDWQRYGMEHSNTDPFNGILPSNLPVFKKIHRTVLKWGSFEQVCGFKLVC